MCEKIQSIDFNIILIVRNDCDFITHVHQNLVNAMNVTAFSFANYGQI